MPKPPALAATVVLHRRAPALEVFWVQRADALQFLGGFHAFPGGRADKSDAATRVQGAEGEAATLIAAAAREVFEECGVLLARGARRVPASEREKARAALLLNAGDFAALLGAHDLVLDARDFVPAGRWQSPPFQPGGFDAQFFLAEMPDGEIASVREGELQRGEWITPDDALARWKANRALLAAPALGTLRELSQRPDATPREWAQELSKPPEARGGKVPRIEVHPGFVLFPVRTPTLAPATHTNCLVIGSREVLVVDPGSPYEDEQEALDEALDALLKRDCKTVKAILVTHHHADHWGGVARLKRRFEVPVHAHAWTAPRVGADAPLEGGETIVLEGDPEFRVEVLFTPGHTPGHLALYERTSGTIVAGDLVSGLSTVVVDPPEGDMRLYVESIRRLRELPATLILPGHGPPIGGPAHRLDFYLTHRAWREGKVAQALRQGPRTVADLVPDVYDDTPPERRGPADRSLLAHLLKLADEGRAEELPDGRWRLLGG